MPPPPLNPQIALYCQGTFSTPNPTPEQLADMLQAAADINTSGFGTVILGQWHVHGDGTIWYNDSPLETVADTLKQVVPALQKGGMKVLLTFGPFGADFTHIADNEASFKQTVAGIQTSSGIDGLDWDLEVEDGNYSPYSDLLVDLTAWANGLGMMVTAAPYQQNDFWTGVLEQTNGGTSAGFSWWNLQLYGGADYPQWVGFLGNLVSNPQAFLVPGYNAGFGSTPDDVQQDLANTKSSYPGLSGGFIWKYESILGNNYTAAQYAEKIAAGVSPTASP
jgi:hypothetical protein